MHIAVDAMGIKHSGGATVLLDFLSAAVNDNRVSRISVFCSPRSKRDFDLMIFPKVHSLEQAKAESSYLYRILWFEHFLGLQCRQIDAEVLLCLVGAGRGSRPRQHVTFVQQSLPFLDGYRKTVDVKERARLTVMERLMSSSCKSAARVIVQTPTMRAWLSQRFAIHPDRITVAMPTVGRFALHSDPPIAKPLLTGHGPKLLYVGNDAPYKNVGVVADGMQRLRDSFPDATLFVTWPLDHPIALRNEVICLGYLPKRELARAYCEATILVMPSLVETVGLPMMEAMSMGLPVLAADRPYARDVCEQAALFFDPLSSADFVRAASALLADEALRQTIADRGRALTLRREQEKPYAKMVDIVLAAAA